MQATASRKEIFDSAPEFRKRLLRMLNRGASSPELEGTLTGWTVDEDYVTRQLLEEVQTSRCHRTGDWDFLGPRIHVEKVNNRWRPVVRISCETNVLPVAVHQTIDVKNGDFTDIVNVTFTLLRFESGDAYYVITERT